MDLQETIRKELRKEGGIPLVIKRRVKPSDIEEAFDYALEENALCVTNPNCSLYRDDSFWVFSKFVIDDMVTLFEQEYFSNEDRIYFSDNEEDYKYYHKEIRQPLINYFWNRMKKKHETVLKKRGSLKEEIGQNNYMDEVSKKINLVRKFIKSSYPEFNKDEVEITKIRPLKSQEYKSYIGEDGMYYAKYLIDERALQLHKEVFDMLENFLGEGLMTYVIEWFNEEFGTNAESVSFMFRLPNF
jgi:hypothetical protein